MVPLCLLLLQDTNCIAPDVPLHSDEWLNVVERFHQKLSRKQYAVVRIQRIQNIALWMRYSRERDIMMMNNGSAGVNERRLW